MQVQQQGEVRIHAVGSIPDGLVPFEEKTQDGAYIISHSEQGHHHVIPGDGVTVMEYKSDNIPAGARVLYAIVEKPTKMAQTAARPHDEAIMAPGMYRLTTSIEVNPFTKMARRVAD